MIVSLRDNIEEVDEQQLAPLLDRLPSWRRELALRFRHHAGRRECTLAFLLLQEALAERLAGREVPPFEYGEHGKPSIPGLPDVHFNLSHCRKAVLCAVADVPVGVDVECIRTFRSSLLEYTMNEQERRQILSAPEPDRAFTALWTRKEAVLKLTGEGIGSQMHDILLPQKLRSQCIRIETFDKGAYIYSIASKEGGK